MRDSLIAGMSYRVNGIGYNIATAINSLFFILTKHPLFLRSSGTCLEIGALSTLLTLARSAEEGFYSVSVEDDMTLAVAVVFDW